MLPFALVLGDRLRDRHSKWRPCCQQEQASNDRKQRAAPCGARPRERHSLARDGRTCVCKKMCVINQITLEIILSVILL